MKPINLPGSILNINLDLESRIDEQITNKSLLINEPPETTLELIRRANKWNSKALEALEESLEISNY